jgi:hypothetical protein
MYAVAFGNAFDGLEFHGPFEDAEMAGEYAEDHAHGSEWNVIKLHMEGN